MTKQEELIKRLKEITKEYDIYKTNILEALGLSKSLMLNYDCLVNTEWSKTYQRIRDALEDEALLMRCVQIKKSNEKKQKEKTRLRNQKAKYAQPCWNCIHAVPNPEKGIGCDWSNFLKPVKNWIADYNEELNSFSIKACPRYKKEV